MAPDPENLISSGVEPVDKIRGGLKPGLLYLVQGTASDASLFAIEFLVEGLKRGETVALIMSYSPEDAVRRFALMGYDCLEDVYSGRLVLLEYTADTIQQIAALSEFAPVLRELEWLLGETKPRRIVFDPITTVLARKDENLAARTLQFSDWASKLGATVLLISPPGDVEVLDNLRPVVAESFRFIEGEIGGRRTRTFVFEKSPEIPPQRIEVNQARGVLLLDRASKSDEAPPIDIQLAEAAPGDASAYPPDLLPTVELEAVDEGPLVERDFVVSEMPASEAAVDESSLQVEPNLDQRQSIANRPRSTEPGAAIQEKAARDEFAELVRDLMNSTTSTQGLGSLQNQSEPVIIQPGAERPSSQSAKATAVPGSQPGRSRAADIRIVASEAARAAESMLEPPAGEAAVTAPAVDRIESPAHLEQLDPREFNILVINDDQRSIRAISQALTGYSLQIVNDGIAALAKLISYKPDLVILDVDLPVVDGFKVLQHIRSSLNMPVVVLSGTRVRSSDRLHSSELGADYFLTKPFSTRELAQKVRQLIARHRGIREWIVTSDAGNEERKETGPLPRTAGEAPPRVTDEAHFAAYDEFARQVEKRVEAAMGGGAPFSVVGCRLPEITSEGGATAVRLFQIIRDMARDTDLTTTNSRNDFMILLPDATAAGARSFSARMRARVIESLKQEPTFWIRTFPESALAARAKGSAISSSEAQLRRRATDKKPPDVDGPAGERRHSSVMRAASS